MKLKIKVKLLLLFLTNKTILKIMTKNIKNIDIKLKRRLSFGSNTIVNPWKIIRDKEYINWIENTIKLFIKNLLSL